MPGGGARVEVAERDATAAVLEPDNGHRGIVGRLDRYIPGHGAWGLDANKTLVGALWGGD